MKQKILFIALFIGSFSWGQSIFTNPLTFVSGIQTSPYTTGQTIDPNITVSGISRGSGITGTAAANRYNANGWSTGVFDANDYFEFTLTPNAGYEINFVSFVYTGQVSTGSPNYAFRSSIDSFVANIGIPTTAGTTISLSSGTYQNITSAITFRFYGYGMSAAGTTYSINDFTFNGVVATTAPCTTPTSQASAISSSNVTTTTADLSWTAGATVAGTLVSLRLASTGIVAPTSGTNYTANTAFGSAGLIDANNKVVYKNTGTTVSGISGLTAGTQYSATPYAYNGAGTNVCFNTTNPESINFYTLALEPTASPASLTCGVSTATTISFTFPAASPAITNASGYVIIYREAATPTPTLVDGTLYATGTVIGDSIFGGYISAAATTFTVSGLNGGTTYQFALIPYGSVLSIAETLNYRLTTPRIQTCSTTPAPEINVKGVIAANPTIVDGDITPSSLDNTLFATVVVGGNQAKNFRIENTGNATLTINSITMVGGNNTEFVASGVSIATFPFTIAAGASIDFTVTFTPTAAGTRSTTLTIANTDSNEGSYDFLIQGTGTVTPLVEINVKGNSQSIPDNSIYPQGTNWTYFPVTVQGFTSTRIFTIENIGTTALSLTGASPYIQISGAHAAQFSVSIIPSNSIAGGLTTTFEITFTPTSGGQKNATILIYNNDTDENPYNFNISGTCQGSNNIYVSGNGYDVPKGSVTTSTTNLTNFGLIAVTSGLKQNTFVITNLSGATRYLSNASVSGTDAAMFTVISQPNNGAFSNGNTTSFTINFTPTSAGVKTATVTFNVYTDSGRTIPDSIDGTFTFAISGEGIVYTACSNNAVQTIAIQDFEAVPATPTLTYGSTTDGTVTLTGGTYNNGSGAVNAYLGARSYQFKGIGTGTTRSAVLTLNSVDVSNYNNINLSMRVGAFRASGSTQGLDVNDLIQIETSIDGGTNWSVESVLKGYTNSRWNFAATGVFTAYYTGNNSGITTDTRNGNAELTTTGISTYYVKNLPQSTALLIRITLNVDRDDELWALDDIKIEGQTAQSSTWTGASWSSGFPTSSTKAIFDAGTSYTTTAVLDHGSVEACELQIKSGATVNIDSNYYFEIQSNITNAGNLTIANNGSLVQINDTATDVGNITYQRTASGVRGFDYVYWSSPVVGQSIGSIYSSPTPGFIFKWNPTATNINSPTSSGNWQSASGTMSVGDGYIMRGSSSYGLPATNITASFAGTINNGVVPVTISRGNNTTPSSVGSGNGITITNFDDNWNLIGNPYPSSIKATDFLAANTNIQGFVYLWTHGSAPASIANPFYGSFLYNYANTDYITYNSLGGSTGPSVFNGYIGGAQGFFVMMNDGATGTATLNFKNNMRNKTYSNSQFYRTSSVGEEERHRIWLDIVNSNNESSRTLVGYASEATLGLDRLYDAFKNTANEMNIYSLAENKTLIIQGRTLPFDDNDQVLIGVTIKTAGTYKIAIAAVDGLFSDATQKIYLEDKLLGVIYDLRQNPYTFDATVGIFNDRFVLRYTENSLSNPDFSSADNTIIVTANHGEMSIKSLVENIQEVTVYDILGRQLFNAKSIENKDFSASNIVMSKQALIVKIKLENGIIVTRKIIL